MTKAEATLWAALRDRGLNGLKFRRQHVLGPYVLDFCCPVAWLIVELDGFGHLESEQQVYDEARTEYLNELGYRVVRFSNQEVMQNLSGVLRRIEDEAGWRGISPHPLPPLPSEGEGNV